VRVNGRIAHVAGLDGLRALAVISVLLYHGGLLAGGFLGVEVFFVISGYLITLILVDEWQRRGHIDIHAFWLRRARRLWPASFAVILATLAITTLFLPNELLSLRDAAFAGLFSVSNWYSILANQSYFEAVGRPPLLRHLWSLSIEAQFYVCWPVLLLLGLRLWRGSLVSMGVAALAGGVFSAIAMAWLYQPDADPSRVYYGTDTRSSGLLIGAALALTLSGRHPRFPRFAADAIGFIALIGLGTMSAVLSEFDPLLYHGGFLIVDVLSAVVIAAAISSRASIGRIVLDMQPLRWIGVRSYGIYLWHWPVYMLTRPQLDVRLDGWLLFLLRVILVGALADLSFRFIETPFRRGRMPSVRAASVLAIGLVLFSTSVAAAKPAQRPAYLPVDAIDTWSAATATWTATTISPQATPTIELVADANREVAADPTVEVTPDPTTTTLPAGSLQAATSPPQSPLGVTAIGDSVMLGAVQALEDEIPGVVVDAAISRQTSTAIQLLRSRSASGQLGDVVIVHMGDNGTFSASQFDSMMEVLADVPRVVFINVKVPRAWEGPNNAVIADGVERYPNTVLVDWHGVGIQRPDFFWDDGIHLRPEGADAYAALIAAHIAL
jgi:peptidoglycan/LPS O-acetylase OafA/YrhL